MSAGRGGKDGWSPYLAGALVGVLAICSAAATTRVLGKTQYLGASTTFVRAAGFLESAVAPDHVAANAYFSKEKVKIDWQFLLLIGLFLGAAASARADGSFSKETVPPVWKDRFGSGAFRRAVSAFLGGGVAMFGARMADGCPSGHGLSGLMQLSVSGFAALAVFFVAGAAVAGFLYGGKRK